MEWLKISRFEMRLGGAICEMVKNYFLVDVGWKWLEEIKEPLMKIYFLVDMLMKTAEK